MPRWIVTNRPRRLEKQMRPSIWRHKSNLSSECVGPSVSLCCCCCFGFSAKIPSEAAERRSCRLRRQQQHQSMMPLMKCCDNGTSQAIKRSHLLWTSEGEMCWNQMLDSVVGVLMISGTLSCSDSILHHRWLQSLSVPFTGAIFMSGLWPRRRQTTISHSFFLPHFTDTPHL